jgi:hypothetical protein
VAEDNGRAGASSRVHVRAIDLNSRESVCVCVRTSLWTSRGVPPRRLKIGTDTSTRRRDAALRPSRQLRRHRHLPLPPCAGRLSRSILNPRQHIWLATSELHHFNTPGPTCLAKLPSYSPRLATGDGFPHERGGRDISTRRCGTSWRTLADRFFATDTAAPTMAICRCSRSWICVVVLCRV